MTKREFVEAMIMNGHVKTITDAYYIIDAFVDTLKDVLLSGESVMFSGLGTFDIKPTKGRSYVNPQTGELVTVGDSVRIKFTTGRSLTRKLKARFEKDA